MPTNINLQTQEFIDSVANQGLIDKNGKPIIPKPKVPPEPDHKHAIVSENIDFVLDRDWGKFAFMVSDLSIGTSEDARLDAVARIRSTASRKFTDTTLGGNLGINCRPQFTRYSDIRNKGIDKSRRDVFVSNTDGNYGMGRYYSEAIDDTSQTIYLRFGLPQFSSLSNFFSAAFDPDMSSIARTGTATSAVRTASRIIVATALLISFPLFSFAVGTAKILAGFFRTSNSKFYSLRPAMHLYWGTVTSLVNAIAINKGIYRKVALLDGPDASPRSEKGTGTQYRARQEDLQTLVELMPGVFSPTTYGYDMYFAATKAQIYANAIAHAEYEEVNAAGHDGSTPSTDTLLDRLSNISKHSLAENMNEIFMMDGSALAVGGSLTVAAVGIFAAPLATAAVLGASAVTAAAIAANGAAADNKTTDPNQGATYTEQMGITDVSTEYSKSPSSNASGNLTIEIDNPQYDAGQTDPNNPPKRITVPAVKDASGKLISASRAGMAGPGFFKSLNAEARQGADFAIFKVNSTGSVSEAFSNSAGESDIGQKLNSGSQSARETRFSFAEGNVTDNAVVGAVTGLLNMGMDALKGGLDAVTFGGFGAIEGLMGAGFLDIPNHWKSSSASLPKASYTIDLVSPYGNPFSQMQNIYIPLSMLLAGTLPLSTGKQSYTSPLLVQVFDRGRCQIQLGMIDSLSIQRGTSNLNFNSRGVALGLKVTFSITDLSSIMHMPVGTGSLFGPDPYSDPDNILMDYLAVLGGMDIYSQIYAFPKARISAAKRFAQWGTKLSSAYWASYTNDSLTSGWMRYVLPISIPYNMGSTLNHGYNTISGR